jgi:predicted RNA binding protein YcfA (HicA-like mRNA interferase family)
MSKAEKLKSKFLSSPPPKDFTWGELMNLMSHLGYKVLEGKGSHKAFYNEATDHYIRGIPKPHPGNEVLICYIKSIKKDLTEVGVI